MEDDNKTQALRNSVEQHGSQNVSPHDKLILDRIFNPNLPYSDIVEETTPAEPEETETENLLEAKRYEVEGVKAAEGADFLLALDYFNKAIAEQPNRASGYNNRAQAYRLLNDTAAAMEDLNKAIELSGSCGKAATQAFTQRGLLYKLEGADELALEDFKKAANLGSIFAKQMLVELNPYAALCNQMMAEMINKVKSGEL